MTNTLSEKWNKIIAKAWADEDYKQRLLTAPEEVLAEEGIAFPEGMKFEVLESTAEKTYLVLPTQSNDLLIAEGDERCAAYLPMY